MAATYNTPNFTVHADSASFARKVGDAAERFRDELAIIWLGQTIPRWANPCIIEVNVGLEMGAGGETTFTFCNGEVYDWKMHVQGSADRILDSVLPHEVTHTIVASYLRAPAPRWLDEGMATSVEAAPERDRYRSMLIGFLRNQRGISFNNMVAMREYPDDLTPFYSQSFSVCEYLICVGGRRRLIEFAKEGHDTNDWNAALKKHYECESLGHLQTEWIAWVREWDSFDNKDVLPATRKLRDFDIRDSYDTMVAHNERLALPGKQVYNIDQRNDSVDNPAMLASNDSKDGGFFGGLRNITDLGKMRAGNTTAIRAQAGEERPEPRNSFGGLPMYGKTIAPFGKSTNERLVEPPVVTDAQKEAFNELDRRNVAPIVSYSEVYAQMKGDQVTARENASNGWTPSHNYLSNGAGSAIPNNSWQAPKSRSNNTPGYYRPAERSSYSSDVPKRY